MRTEIDKDKLLSELEVEYEKVCATTPFNDPYLNGIARGIERARGIVICHIARQKKEANHD